MEYESTAVKDESMMLAKEVLEGGFHGCLLPDYTSVFTYLLSYVAQPLSTINYTLYFLQEGVPIGRNRLWRIATQN